MRRHNFFTLVSGLTLRACALSLVTRARLLVILLLCCSLLAHSPTTAQQRRTIARQLAHASLGNAFDPSVVRERNLAVFDEAWHTIGERYYDRNFHGVDWQAVRAKFRPLAASATDEQTLYAVLRQMIAPLRDPHTRAMPASEQFNWQDLRALSVGISVREIRRVGFFVEQVAEDSEAQRQGARPGDEIISVDNEPVPQRIGRLMNGAVQTPANISTDDLIANNFNTDFNTEGDDDLRARAFSLIFYGAPDTFVDISLRDPQGLVKRLRVRRELRPRTVNFSSSRVVNRNGTRFGVVRFDLFKAAAVGQLARALNRDLRDTDGLVIDFRRNGGGELEAMVDAASMFLPPDTALGEFFDRDGRAAISARTRAKFLTATEDVPQYRRPIVILSSAQTASAAEVFAAALRDAGDTGEAGNKSNAGRNVRVIGERSCGCVLGVRRFHKLPDGGTLMVSELDYLTARRERLEQRGVAPAVSVAPTREDLIRRRDPALTQALSSLASMSRTD